MKKAIIRRTTLQLSHISLHSPHPLKKRKESLSLSSLLQALFFSFSTPFLHSPSHEHDVIEVAGTRSTLSTCPCELMSLTTGMSLLLCSIVPSPPCWGCDACVALLLLLLRRVPMMARIVPSVFQAICSTLNSILVGALALDHSYPFLSFFPSLIFDQTKDTMSHLQSRWHWRTRRAEEERERKKNTQGSPV